MEQGGVVPNPGELDLPSLDLSSEFFSLPQNQNTDSVIPEATANPLPQDAGFDEIYSGLQFRAQEILSSMSADDRLAKYGMNSESNILNDIEDEIASANEKSVKMMLLETEKINKNYPSASAGAAIVQKKQSDRAAGLPAEFNQVSLNSIPDPIKDKYGLNEPVPPQWTDYEPIGIDQFYEDNKDRPEFTFQPPDQSEYYVRGMFMGALYQSDYNKATEEYNANINNIISGVYKEEVYNPAYEEYKTNFEKYEEDYKDIPANLDRFLREVDFESVGVGTLNNFDFSGAELSNEHIPVKLDYGLSTRGKVQYADLFPIADTKKGSTEADVIGLSTIIREDILKQSNEEILSLQSELDELTPIIEKFDELIEDAQSGQEAAAIAENMNIESTRERVELITTTIENLEQGIVTDEMMQNYGGKFIDNIILNKLALTEEEWEASDSKYKSDTYEGYIKKLENLVFKSSMYDENLVGLSKEIYGEEQPGGMIGIRPMLDQDVEIGARYDYWKERELDWEIGWNETMRAMSVISTGLQRMVLSTNRGGDAEQQFLSATLQEESDMYVDRLENYNNTLKLQKSTTSRSENTIKTFGESLFANRDHIDLNATKAYENALDVSYDVEVASMGRQSAPMSLFSMVAAMPFYLTGNFVAGSVTQSSLMGAMSGSLFYHDVLNRDRRYAHLSDSARLGYAWSHGAAEFGGELAGNLIFGKILGLNKFGGRFSPYRSLYKGVTKSGAPILRANPNSYMARQFLFGTAYGAAVSVPTEYTEEWFTGTWQEANEQLARGEELNGWKILDKGHEGGRVGAYMGPWMNAGMIQANNVSAMYHRTMMNNGVFETRARMSILNQYQQTLLDELGVSKKEFKKMQDLMKKLGVKPGMNPTEYIGLYNDPKNKTIVDELFAITSKLEADIEGVNAMVDAIGTDFSNNPENASIMAGLIIEDNLRKQAKFMNTEVTINSAGRAVDQFGRFLPKGWEDSYFGQESAKLTPEQRKAEGLKAQMHKRRFNLLTMIVQNDLHNKGFTTSGLDTQEGKVDRTKNALDLTEAVLAEGAITEELKAQLQEAGMNNDQINQLDNILKENADLQIIVHKTEDSMGKVAAGAEGMYIESESDSFIGRDGKMVKSSKKELHLDITNLSDLSRVLTHEYGHLVFENFVNGQPALTEEAWNAQDTKDEETYEEYVGKQKEQSEKFVNELAQQIIGIDDAKIKDIVNFTFMVEGLEPSSYEQALKDGELDVTKLNLTDRQMQVINKELIINFMEAMSRGEFIRRNADGSIAVNTTGIDLRNADMGFKQWGNALMLKYGVGQDLDFSMEDDAITMALKFSMGLKNQQKGTTLGMSSKEQARAARQQREAQEQVDAIESGQEIQVGEYTVPMVQEAVDSKIDEGMAAQQLMQAMEAMSKKTPGLNSKFLNNTTIYFKIQEMGFRGSLSAQTRITNSNFGREKHLEFVAKDYKAFADWYNGWTGNQIKANKTTDGGMTQIMDMYYLSDKGEKVLLTPPPRAMSQEGWAEWKKIKADQGYVTSRQRYELGNTYPRIQNRYKSKSYHQRKREAAMDEDALRSKLSYERRDILNELGDVWRSSDKKISFYTNISDFTPEYEKGRYDDSEGVRKDNEAYRIAIDNIHALIASDINEDDLKALAGRSGVVSKSKHPSIFNMSGRLMPETHEQKAIRLNTEIQEYGEAWQLLPKDSDGYKQRIGDLRIANEMELEYASQRMHRLRNGESLEGDDISLDPGLASRILGKMEGKMRGISSPMVEGYDTSENFVSWLLSLGLTRDQFVINKYNYDPQIVGDVTINIPTEKRGTAKYTFYSSGGVMGGQALKNLGADRNMITSHSSDETASAAMTSMIKASRDGKIHVSVYTVLDQDNSLNSARQFSGLMGYLKKFAESNPSKVNDIIDVINEKFNNQYTKAEIDGETIRYTMGNRFATKMGRKAGIINTVSVDKRTPSIQIENQEGLINFLSHFENMENTMKLGFVENVRRRFANSIMGSRGIPKKVDGVLSKAEYLSKINQPQFSNAKSGDIVAATLLENAGDIMMSSDIRMEFGEGNSPELQKFIDNIGYVNAVHTSADTQTVFFEKFVPGSLIDKSSHARKTSGFSIQTAEDLNKDIEDAHTETSTNPGYASRRLGGRIYAQGNSLWEKSEATAYGRVLERLALKFQDSYSGIMLLQQDVEVFRKSKVPQSQDFEMAMDIMYGVVRTDLELIEAELEKITFATQEAGFTAEEVSDYLYAKHARERNEYIMGIRPEMESGSGMTNEQAEEIINELESPQMVTIANLVYGVIKNTRSSMVEGGLEKASTIQTWEDLYDNYVPLSGRAVDEMDDTTNNYPTGGAGMAIYGKTTKAAKGRPSKTGVNLIANVIMQNAQVKQRARKDQAMLSLYNLIKNNPNEKVWNIYSAENPKMKVDKGEQVPMNVFEMKSSRNMVPIRINGEQHFMYFNQTDYANALNGMTVEKLNSVAKQAGKLMNFMRNSFTQYNPSFFLMNFFRDIHGAMYNVLAEVEREGGIMSGYGVNSKKFTKDVITGSFTALGQLLNESMFNREMSVEMKQYKEEWEAAGGRTGFSYSESIQNVMEDLRKGAETKSRARQGAEYVFSKPSQFFNYIAAINEAFENAIRLSSYIEARKVGATKQRAAQLSKNVTINFNKSGELSATLNSIYLFFNASVQGVTRFNRTFGSIKGDLPNNPDETESWRNRLGKQTTSARLLAAGSVLMSALQTAINLLMSDRDPEDGELYWNKIPGYKKERGFSIMYNGKDAFHIPLGYGYNMFHVIGQQLAEVAFGNKHADDAMMYTVLAGHSSFSPIAMGHSTTVGGSLLKGALPTVFKAPTDAFAFNETYHGGQVYQKPFAFGAEDPASSLSFRSPDMIQEAFVALNEMTGGSENISSTTVNTYGVDVNPDPVYYILQSYWGGAGDFLIESAGLGRAGLTLADRKFDQLMQSQGNDDFITNLLSSPEGSEAPIIKFSDVPVLKSIYGGPSRFYDFDLYEKNTQEILQFEQEAKKGGDTRTKFNYVGIGELKVLYNNTEQQLGFVRDAKRQARQIEDYIERSNEAYRLQEIERIIVTRFNARYYELRGQFVDPKPEGIIPLNDLRKALGTDE